MSEFETYYQEFVSPGAWVREDPDLCGCGGSGWFLSQVDTWHKCQVHNDGQPHPEDDNELSWLYYEGKLPPEMYITTVYVVDLPIPPPLKFENDIPF